MLATLRTLRRLLRRRFALAALFFFATVGQGFAHNVTPDPVVDVFLRATGDRLAVKVWLPIAALSDANLPRTPDGHFVPGEIGPALDLVARGIARDLELQQGNEPLPTPTLTTTLSPDESFVAIDLEYHIDQNRDDLSGRFHTFRANGQVIATRAHYVVNDRTTRTFAVDGPPERITFEPGVLHVLQRFIDKGTDLLLSGAQFLMFAVCLIAVGRPRQAIIVASAALLAGQAVAAVLSVGGFLVIAPSAEFIVEALGASAIVVLALQNLASPRSRWLTLLCLAFGATSGAEIGATLSREWAFAGTHVFAGLIGSLLTLSVGEIWIVALLWSAAGLIRRRGRVADLAVMSLSLFAGHAALHRIADAAQQLADTGIFTLDRFLFALIAGWAVVILSAGILDALLPARRSGGWPLFVWSPDTSEGQ